MSLRANRKFSFVMAILSAVTVLFTTLVPTAANAAAATITVTNLNPLADPYGVATVAVSQVAPGDTILVNTSIAMKPDTTSFTFAGKTSPITVAASAPTGATNASDFTVQVPTDAVTGTLTVADTANGGNSGTFSLVVWVSRSEPYAMPNGHLNLTIGDLSYVLDQIKIGEAHSARTSKTVAGSTTVGTGTLSTAAASTVSYPYDNTSTTRCLQASDLATAKNSVGGLTNAYLFSPLDPLGVRTVDGQCNNISNVQSETAPNPYSVATAKKTDTAGWGSSDQTFLRIAPSTLLPATTNTAYTGKYALNPTQKSYQFSASQLGFVTDPQPRIISNLISDQTSGNTAAVNASKTAYNVLYGDPLTANHTEVSVNATTSASSDVYQVPNVTADFNASPGFNSWMTLFGQFFDHGLDLIPKNESSVYIPVQTGDPLYRAGSSANFMVLTRGTNANDNAANITTPWIDLSQNYGSHASQNVFLREYHSSASGPVFTGRLLEGTDRSTFLANGTGCYATTTGCESNGALATWRDVKNQAKYVLGIALTDYDVSNIPVIATDQYGKYIRDAQGYPFMLMRNAGTSQYQWQSKNTTGATLDGGALATGTGTANTWKAVSSGHAFINDTMAAAVPWGTRTDRVTAKTLTPDTDTIIESAVTAPAPASNAEGFYDDEALGEHFVAGDGRANENIGLSAVHSVLHSEHNLIVKDIKDLIKNHPTISSAFQSQWHTGTADWTTDALWNNERLYQAARMVTEMEYQHLAFDEFILRLSPNIPGFAYSPTTNPAISQEFASAVYRLGHSMLTETIARSNPGEVWSPTSNQDVSLLTGFTNPAQMRLPRALKITSATSTGTSSVEYTYTGSVHPWAGAIMTISNMEDPTFNLKNAIVKSVDTDTHKFVVEKQFAISSNGSASAIAVTDGTTTGSMVHTGVTTSNIAEASFNDPGYVLDGSGNPTSTPIAYTYSAASAAAMVAQGMSQQRANEIDEFVTDAVRNNLLGLPLDLASLNLARGRETGVPTLNQFRSKNAAALPPYVSWNSFFNQLRYSDSAVNFLAAYGTHPSIATTKAVTITRATYSSTTSVTYTYTGDDNLANGDVINITGFTGTNAARFNLKNAVVASLNTGANTFVVSKTMAHAPSATVAFSSAAAQYADFTSTGTTITAFTSGTTAITASGAAAKESTNAQRRAAAAALLAGSVSDSSAFLNATGAWANVETGINYVDLWIGGLAETPQKQPILPGMLGSTFLKVFDDQMSRLRNGDRFYYLGRVTGTNLFEEFPAQTFTDIVRRNTPSASSDPATSGTTGVLGMDSRTFGISDCFWQARTDIAPSNQVTLPSAPVGCASGSQVNDGHGATLHVGQDNPSGFGPPASTVGVMLTGGSADDSLQGTRGGDVLSGGAGGDFINGNGGNDIIHGNFGDDVIRGNHGDDVINVGESVLGDIADGGAGVDYIINGGATGAAASFIGEAGNDFIQGGIGADALLEGGEGDDWIEGGAGADGLTGDLGIFPGGGQAKFGGNDVLNGGPEADIIDGGGGQDIILLGAGAQVDGATGGIGFDFANYEYNQRFDNGQTLNPGVYVDMSGATPNPLNLPGDALTDFEGVAGSPGNDVLIGQLASNFRVPAGQVTGAPSGTTLVLTGTWSNIATGMQVTGTGIPVGAQVLAPGVTRNVGGVTTTQVAIDIPLPATIAGGTATNVVIGAVDFKVWPMKNILRTPTVTGMYDLLKDSTLTQVAPAVAAAGNNIAYPALTTGYDAVNDTWSGGSILLGGAGNDSITATTGTNIVHGSAQLHTCIQVQHAGQQFKTGADVPCGNSLGYSSMTALNDYLADGTLTPSDLRVVRELTPTSVNIISATVSAGNLVFTTEYNTLQPGDLVTITGTSNAFNNAASNVPVVGTPTPTSFTIALPAGGAASTGGKVVATDTLNLPLAIGSYQIEQLGVLPIGATSGYKFTEVTAAGAFTGNSVIAYDIQRVSFAGAAAQAVSGLASALTRVGFSALSMGGSITAGPAAGNSKLIAALPPAAFSPTVRRYYAIANPGVTSVSVAFTRAGTVTSVQLTVGATTTTVSAALSAVAVNIATNRTFTLTVNKAGGPIQYVITVLPAGLTPTFDSPRPIAGGFTANVTNCDTNNFTYSASATGASVSTPVQIPNTSQCFVKVTGLTAGQASTLSVTATAKAGIVTSIPAPATASVSYQAGSSLATAPIMTNPESVANGFTSTIANYDAANYSYTVSSTSGNATRVGDLVTVDSLADAEHADLTVTATSLSGLGAASTTITGQAQANIVPNPTLAYYGAADRTDNIVSLTVEITNYDAALSYGCAPSILAGTTLDPTDCALSTTGSGPSLKHLITISFDVTGLTNGDLLTYLVQAGSGDFSSNSAGIVYQVGDPGTQTSPPAP